ncbi:hypothetical protein EDD21DRAFT_380825, partial [Dissophora ornata]
MSRISCCRRFMTTRFSLDTRRLFFFVLLVVAPTGYTRSHGHDGDISFSSDPLHFVEKLGIVFPWSKTMFVLQCITGWTVSFSLPPPPSTRSCWLQNGTL